MSDTAAQLRVNAEALRQILEAYPLAEEVAQVVVAAQLNLDHAALLLDAADEGIRAEADTRKEVEADRIESVARARGWGTT